MYSGQIHYSRAVPAKTAACKGLQLIFWNSPLILSRQMIRFVRRMICIDNLMIVISPKIDKGLKLTQATPLKMDWHLLGFSLKIFHEYPSQFSLRGVFPHGYSLVQLTLKDSKIPRVNHCCPSSFNCATWVLLNCSWFCGFCRWSFGEVQRKFRISWPSVCYSGQCSVRSASCCRGSSPACGLELFLFSVLRDAIPLRWCL